MTARRGVASLDRRCQIIHLYLVEYGDASRFQRELADARGRGLIPDTLVLLEHPPVLTLGRRANRENVLFSEEQLRQRGIALYQSSRGGDVTYHGPGQLVGYPILGLRDLGIGAAAYVHTLEATLIDLLHAFGVEGRTDPDYIGVWVGRQKVAAIGVAISGGVTMHGFALNVDPDLSHFQLINPCGITDRGVTSLSRVIGRDFSVDEVRPLLIESFERRFGIKTFSCQANGLAELGISLPLATGR